MGLVNDTRLQAWEVQLIGKFMYWSRSGHDYVTFHIKSGCVRRLGKLWTNQVRFCIKTCTPNHMHLIIYSCISSGYATFLVNIIFIANLHSMMVLCFYILSYMSILDGYADFSRKKYIKSEKSAIVCG